MQIGRGGTGSPVAIALTHRRIAVTTPTARSPKLSCVIVYIRRVGWAQSKRAFGICCRWRF